MATEKIAKRAKLWNRGRDDYKETVNGKEVYIPKGGYIECSRHEALDIRGYCTGLHKPVHLEIELLDPEAVKVAGQWTDHRTGATYPSEEAFLKATGQEKPATYLCPVCDASFTTPDDAKNHIKECVKTITGQKKKAAQPEAVTA